MATILLIHGPNLNRLGKRDAAQYGTKTLADIEALVAAEAQRIGHTVKAFQSNHEGALIDFLQAEATDAAGIIANLGAFTHYSYALHDALVDTDLPCVEVHLSDINSRRLEKDLGDRTGVYRNDRREKGSRLRRSGCDTAGASDEID